MSEKEKLTSIADATSVFILALGSMIVEGIVGKGNKPKVFL